MYQFIAVALDIAINRHLELSIVTTGKGSKRPFSSGTCQGVPLEFGCPTRVVATNDVDQASSVLGGQVAYL